MTEKKLLRALKGEVMDTPPIWLMRQAGRYLPEYRKVKAEAGSFLNLCYTPKHAIEVTLQPIRRYGFDAAILFSDLPLIAQGLGQELWYEEGGGPRLAPIRNGVGVAALDVGQVSDRLAPVYETVAGLSTALPSETTLIGFAGAPWTVACYMVEGGGSREFAEVKGWAFRNPEEFGSLIDILVDATAVHLCNQARAGAEVLQIFDSWASILPDTAFRRWIIAPTKALVGRIRAEFPDIPIIGFPRAAGVMYAEYVAETGVTAVSLDTTMSRPWAAENLQTKMPVQGNLDPLALVNGGDCLEEEVRETLEGFSGRPFVFNLGHGIVKETPPEHVAALVALVRGETV